MASKEALIIDAIHATFKSGTEFTVHAVQFPWPLIWNSSFTLLHQLISTTFYSTSLEPVNAGNIDEAVAEVMQSRLQRCRIKCSYHGNYKRTQCCDHAILYSMILQHCPVGEKCPVPAQKIPWRKSMVFWGGTLYHGTMYHGTMYRSRPG